MQSLTTISYHQTRLKKKKKCAKTVYKIELFFLSSQIKSPIKDDERWFEFMTFHQTILSYHIEIQKRFIMKNWEKNLGFLIMTSLENWYNIIRIKKKHNKKK